MTNTTTGELSPFAQRELDREFRTAKAMTEASTVEVHIGRVLMEMGIIEAAPRNVAAALSAAARLNAGAISASVIRRNYPMGGLTHDFVSAIIMATR